jgi:hypothetical protein
LLQTLEVRIRYLQVNASAVCNYNVALLFEKQDDAAVVRRDITESMRELLPLIQGQPHRDTRFLATQAGMLLKKERSVPDTEEIELFISLNLFFIVV